jgi:4-azaleucine resistance transporter AzlC
VGLTTAFPVLLGYAPIGVAYGVLAHQAGLTLTETAALSLFVYAGSSQFIAVAMWQAGAGALAIIFTTFLVNLRHFLMSAALSPHLGRYSKRWLTYFGGQLTDETFAVHSARLGAGDPEYAGQPLLVVNQAAHLAWALTSVVGYLVGTTLGNPQRLGLDFALPAMFVALLFMQLRRKLDLLVAALAAGLSLGLPYLIPGRWNVLLAAVVAAAAGALLAGPPARRAAGEPATVAEGGEAGAD